MELAPAIGVGVSDLQHAIRTEIDSIAAKTKGDAAAQSRLLIERLRERDLITEKDAGAITRLAELSEETDSGKRSAKDAYFEARHLYDVMLANGDASPVALVVASSAVGSYSISDGPDGVVFAKSNGNWETRGTAAGALIGSVWGPQGAVIGGAVGGLIGAAVDKCSN